MMAKPSEKPYFSDPKKEEKLKEAIRLGFIVKSIDPDGIVRYTLTKRGMDRWMFETVFGVRPSDAA